MSGIAMRAVAAGSQHLAMKRQQDHTERRAESRPDLLCQIEKKVGPTMLYFNVEHDTDAWVR